MFATSGDILKMSLAIGFILLVIFLCFLIFYTILVMRDVSKMTSDAEEVVSKFKKTIVKPLNMADFMFSKLQPYIETVVESLKKDKK